MTGGIAATGNYPGKARTADELRHDLDVVYSLLPGSHRLNLHAIYLESDKKVERNAIEPQHFSAWMDWAKADGHGLDFNPTCFSHPLAADGFTLSHRDPASASSGLNTASPAAKSANILARNWARRRDEYLDSGRLQGFSRLTVPRPAACCWKPSTRFWLKNCPTTWTLSSPNCLASARKVTSPVRWSSTPAYAVSRKVLLTLDAGHFHPTETIADKISSHC